MNKRAREHIIEVPLGGAIHMLTVSEAKDLIDQVADAVSRAHPNEQMKLLLATNEGSTHCFAMPRPDLAPDVVRWSGRCFYFRSRGRNEQGEDCGSYQEARTFEVADG